MEHTTKVERRLNLIWSDMVAGIHRTCTAAKRTGRGTADRNTKGDVSVHTGTENNIFGCIIPYRYIETFSWNYGNCTEKLSWSDADCSSSFSERMSGHRDSRFIWMK